MDEEIRIDGVSIASGVIETIVSMTAAEVDGVAGIGSANTLTDGIRSVLGSHTGTHPGADGVEVSVTEDDLLRISIRFQVLYGYRLVDVAVAVRAAVADIVLSQVGVAVAAVDLYIDGVVFAEKHQ
jgi:uncharacterized alkaline shock family protein YloU